MVLLTAMFMSTCYWPPVPIQTPLVRPWSENVTTFEDALHMMMPNLPQEKVPSTIPVADRCWCDVSNGFFSPFNATKWEEQSVLHVKETLEKEMAMERRAREKAECEAAAGEEVAELAACQVTAEQPVSPVPNPTPTFTLFRLTPPEQYIWDVFQALLPRPTPTPPTPSPATSLEGLTASGEPSPKLELAMPESPQAVPEGSSVRWSWLRREYDLRRFGFAMVVDFGWPASSQSS